jgi:hypothetical protein
MCAVSQQILDLMEKTVRQFLDEGRMFTAYDVTIETRNREKIKLLHSETKGAVHEVPALVDAIEYGYADQGGNNVSWQKSQIPMPNGHWAFVYHPANLDPQTYQPRQTNGGSAQATTVQTLATSSNPTPAVLGLPSTASDSGGENDDGTYSPNYHGCLFIPTKFVREAGLAPGDLCHIVTDKNNKMIFLVADDAQFQNNGFGITTKRVERNGDLRLYSRTLKEADLSEAKYRIENVDRNNTKIVEVAPAP